MAVTLQVLPLQVQVDLGVMSIKGYFIVSKVLGLKPHYPRQFSIISRTFVGRVILLLCRRSIGRFYSPNRRDHQQRVKTTHKREFCIWC